MSTEELLKERIKRHEDSIIFHESMIEKKIQELTEHYTKKQEAIRFKQEYENDLETVLSKRSIQEAPRK